MSDSPGNLRTLTTAEKLAIAVLRGDEEAALELADLVLETYHGKQVLPTSKITAALDRIRVAIYLRSDVPLPDRADRQTFIDGINGWLSKKGRDPQDNLLFLTGVERMELYELPEGS